MTSISGRARLLSACVTLFGVAFAAHADPSEGEALFKRQCAVCHSVQPGQVLAGPSLAGIMDRPAAAESFRYSPSMKSSGIIWDQEAVNGFIESPRKMVPGTYMAFPGERNPEKREAIVEYLVSLS